MSIKSDAYSILNFIVENKNSNSSKISEYFEYDKERTIDALRYLEEKSLVEIRAKTVGGHWNMIRATAYGIDHHESLNQEKKAEEERKTKEEPPQKDALNQISRIEKNVNALLSRKHREMTYHTALYPIIIASFIAIGFTSGIEFLKVILPENLKFILNGTFYFLILISIGIAFRMLEKMRLNLDVDNYIASFKIKSEEGKYNLLKVLRKVFEYNEHQLATFKSEFEGFLINDIKFYMESRGEDINRKEEILRESFNKKIKKTFYDFDYVNRKNILSSLIFDMKNSKVKIVLDRGIDFKVADRVLDELNSKPELELIEKSGWDH